MPVVNGNLLNSHILSRTIDGSLDITCLIAVAVADTDVILTCLRQLQLMAQRTIRTCLRHDKAQTGKVGILLCPPARIGQLMVYTLTIHVLGLDNDGTLVGFRLFRCL